MKINKRKAVNEAKKYVKQICNVRVKLKGTFKYYDSINSCYVEVTEKNDEFDMYEPFVIHVLNKNGKYTMKLCSLDSYYK